MMTNPVSFAFETIDLFRKGLGALLDISGFLPPGTPHSTLYYRKGMTLRSYGNPAPGSPPVLLVPAPIKRGHLWDLLPWASVVKRCLEGGLSVYLIQWEDPDEENGDGLGAYADQYLTEALDHLAGKNGHDRMFLAGYSLGGTLAAIFSTLHQDRVRGLILLGSPLNFAADSGPFSAMAKGSPPARVFSELFGNVPGSFLDAVSLIASPHAFITERWIDWLNSWSDILHLIAHVRVSLWTLGEIHIARQLFEDVMESLFRENLFMKKQLQVNGQSADPSNLTIPILSVILINCAVAPPLSMLAFHGITRSTDTQVLWYGGDSGVSLQHLGMMVGMNAHRDVWPAVIRWIHSHAG